MKYATFGILFTVFWTIVYYNFLNKKYEPNPRFYLSLLSSAIGVLLGMWLSLVW